jgi:hypothetical protein
VLLPEIRGTLSGIAAKGAGLEDKPAQHFVRLCFRFSRGLLACPPGFSSLPAPDRRFSLVFVGTNPWVGNLSQAFLMRVGREVETQGLDLTAHGESGYNVAFGGTSQ